MSDLPFEQAARDILSTAVANEHPGADPRPQQAELTGHIISAMENTSHLAAEGQTGTGKSYALLAPAYAAAAIKGERTVVSTQSLALQSQILGSDAPAMQRATREVTGKTVTLKLLKGFSNYGCIKATLEHATEALHITATPDRLAREAENRSDLPGTAWLLGGIAEMEAGTVPASINGERSACPEDIAEEEWRKLSISSDDCSASMPGGCDWAKEGKCFVRRAVLEASIADIVVTNHALLGIQAATNVPAVLGRPNEKKPFSHLMVDECHSLAESIRNQASEDLTPASFGGRLRRINRLVTTGQNTVVSFGYAVRLSAKIDSFVRDADEIIVVVEDQFRAATARKPEGRNDFLLLSQGQTPFVPMVAKAEGDPTSEGGQVKRWLENYRILIQSMSANAYTQAESEGHHKDDFFAKAMQNLTRADRSLEKLVETFTVLDEGGYEGYDPNMARWIQFEEISRGNWVARSFNYSAVDVSGLCQESLWQYTSPADQMLHELSVTCLSATIDRDAFLPETGLLADGINTYRSPFDEAYAESMAYIPVARKTDPDFTQLISPKGFFDVRRHAEWCAPRIVEMVKANRGHALILCATRTNAEKYVEALRQAGIEVYDHLNTTARRAVLNWKEHPGSVLVGLKSLMVGVDAPGEECSLVVLDRPPRSPMNALDDQRAKLAGDVYVSDTVTLMRQAVGRLIRKTTDRGLVAIMDPRISDQTEQSIRYKQSGVRAKYKGVVRDFGRFTSEWDSALRFLAEQAAHRPEVGRTGGARNQDGTLDWGKVWENVGAQQRAARGHQPSRSEQAQRDRLSTEGFNF